MNQPVFAPPLYPIAAFPLILREAAWELQAFIQAPDAMIAMALEAAMSIACQGLADVKLPTGQIRPCSLNLLCIGESGERKSTIDSLVFKPLYAHDMAAAIEHEKAVKGGYTPRLRRFIRQNSTERALGESAQGNGESLGVILDEGDGLRSRAMSAFMLVNKLADGAPLITIDRAGSDLLLIMNPRVTVSIMTQLAPLQAFLRKRGDLARGTGFWARYLVGWPLSTQGYRATMIGEPIWTHLPKFHARLEELVQQYAERIVKGPIDRLVIEFTDDAKARWFALSANLEWMLRPGEYYHDINDFASKSMEIMGRLAALFHFFSGETGKITVDTLERALTVVQWHGSEFKRLFSPEFAVQQHQVDAVALLRYLRERVWRGPNSQTSVAKNHLLRFGPIRKRDQLNAAIHWLESFNAIWIGTVPETKQKFVCLSDPYFAAL